MELRTVNYPLFVLTALVALVATISLFPASWNFWRPEWVALLVIYWVLRAPAHFGMITAWALGLFVDVLEASVLGLHAAAFSLLAFLVLSAHQRMKLYPVGQQSLLVFLFIGLGQMLIHFLQHLVGTPQDGLHYLLPALTSAVVWPVLVVFLDGMNRKLG